MQRFRAIFSTMMEMTTQLGSPLLISEWNDALLAVAEYAESHQTITVLTVWRQLEQQWELALVAQWE